CAVPLFPSNISEDRQASSSANQRGAAVESTAAAQRQVSPQIEQGMYTTDPKTPEFYGLRITMKSMPESKALGGFAS
ncbi:MAG TPA: hypothetical protein VFE08_02370, partial [Candidatus Sulfotelmatobacter sp.]|nr:hypothetical protein [Candidatus Sulfotelmatobacter sp.]